MNNLQILMAKTAPFVIAELAKLSYSDILKIERDDFTSVQPCWIELAQVIHKMAVKDRMLRDLLKATREKHAGGN